MVEEYLSNRCPYPFKWLSFWIQNIRQQRESVVLQDIFCCSYPPWIFNSLFWSPITGVSDTSPCILGFLLALHPGTGCPTVPACASSYAKLSGRGPVGKAARCWAGTSSKGGDTCQGTYLSLVSYCPWSLHWERRQCLPLSSSTLNFPSQHCYSLFFKKNPAK